MKLEEKMTNKEGNKENKEKIDFNTLVDIESGG